MDDPLKVVERIHALADGDSTVGPHPTAQDIGALARGAVDAAAHRGYITKGHVEQLRKRAEDLHIEGFRATAGSARFDWLLSELAPPANANYALDAIFKVMKDANRNLYESERRLIASSFTDLEVEILSGAAPKKRGRPSGVDPADRDRTIIGDAIQSLPVIRTDIDTEGGRRSELRRFNKGDLPQLIDSLLRKKIGDLPSRGDEGAKTLQTHKKRLVRKARKLFPDKKSE